MRIGIPVNGAGSLAGGAGRTPNPRLARLGGEGLLRTDGGADRAIRGGGGVVGRRPNPAPGPGEPYDKVERVPEQLAIYDSKPGDPEYSPIWHYHYVVVPRDYKPNTLRSEADVQRSGYRVVPVDHYSN